GELVVDPFVGGGTTLVEAVASGRLAIGSDISSLATFVTQVKTRIYTEPELEKLLTWAEHIPKNVNCRSPRQIDQFFVESGYLRNLDGPAAWRLRNAIGNAINAVLELR